VEFIISVKLIG